MSRFRTAALRAALLAFAGLIGAGSGSAASAAPLPLATREAILLAQAETLVPLEQVFASLRKRYGDETRKNATIVQLPDAVQYRIVWITDNGRKLNILVDAKTGQVISAEGG